MAARTASSVTGKYWARNRYLVERYAISYLTSGRDLLRLQVERDSKMARWWWPPRISGAEVR
jgi:hypothetical protein